MASNRGTNEYDTEVQGVALQVDNCEKSCYNGDYKEHGSKDGKTRYKNVKGGKYEIFWSEGNWVMGVSTGWSNDDRVYVHPTSTGAQPPEEGWVDNVDNTPSNTLIRKAFTPKPARRGSHIA